MSDLNLRRSFIALHLTLGLVILFESARALIHALGAANHGHLAVAATVEMVAALLFLWPRTMRVGGVALVVILLGAVLRHGLQGQVPTALLVYAAAALFVTVHGSAWGPARPPAAA